MKKYRYPYEPVVPKTLRGFVNHATKPYRLKILGFFLITLVGVVAMQAAPYVISLIVNALANNQMVTDAVWWLVVLYVALILIDEVAWRISEIYLRTYKPQMVERVRSSLFTAILKRPHTFFVNSSSGRIGYWVNRTAETVNTGVDLMAWTVWGSVTSLIVSSLFLFLAHWSLAVLFIVWLVLVFLFNLKRGETFGKLSGVKGDEESIAAGMVVDAVTNNVSVRVFEGRDSEAERLSKQQDRIIAAWRKQWWHHAVTNTVKGWSTVVANAIAMIIILTLYSSGEIQVGDIVLFIAYFGSAGMILWELAWALDSYFNLFGIVRNALDGLNGEDEREVHERKQYAKPNTAALNLQGVSFAYPEQPKIAVLDKLDLSVEAGKKIGLVGHSGAGKSTLVGLLLGFYEPTSGDIVINDESTSQHDPSYMRNLTAYVPQDTQLFNRTIRENIIYADPSASEEELIHALTMAQAKDFVMKLPKGLDTLVGERGVKLSGGQRQRIAVARAILREAPLIVLDEATSALDSVSEQEIQKAFTNLMKGKTAIVVAHRLSTLKHLDEIVVMDKGKIVEQGSHDALVTKKNGIYADLWKRQKDGFIAE